jgi:DNA-binding NarL/FixJ family response regulator
LHERTRLDGVHVLIAEDEALIATELQELLTAFGAVIAGVAPTTAEAEALANTTQRLDAAVFNVRLRDGVVFPLVQTLAERGVKVVFWTGYDEALIPAELAQIPRVSKLSDPMEIVRAIWQD